VYDYGMSPDGDLYYAMELLDGYDLESLVARFGPQPEARVARILAQACLSLAEAHRAGLVHRDVKPGNLMLCRLGEDLDIAKVLDFGLVGAAQNQPAVPGSAHGATGFAGTPGYIAPELIFGGGMATPASDLYGLGAVGYWLLTGSTVFPATDGSEDLVAHSMDRPKPPSERLGRRIQPQLEALILACLAKKPAERPASALALRESLLAIVFAETWHEEQARSWWLEAGART
jgi:serine/threonine-protein kinase